MIDPTTFYGGALGFAISADYTIVDRRKRILSFLQSADGFKVKLPDARLLRPGANVFFIVSEHATRTLLVVDNAGALLATLTGHQAAKCNLESNATAAGVWRVRIVGW